jgi:Uncharacterized protein conserved in bacteria (DUF2330)
MIQALSKAAVVVVAALSLWSQRAEACGCFAPPDPSVPIVQAGERILFAVDNGKVTAHIQIQYAGDAKDFGWLLPLPSVPTLKIGTEELFTALINTTQPRYFVNTKLNGNCNGGIRGLGGTAGPSADGSFNAGGAEGGKSPLVLQSSIGPYDYAVLKADNKDAMLKWLSDNRYFVPAGTEDVVGPYINPGAYFLALKLKSGKATGDIQPVVLEYPSALPMIPIILTSVAANPNMGIQVWMLGQGRAIPRNYHHVVINDAQLDWLNQASNYNDVIIKAVSEAPEKHAFATEYAGPSDVMRDVLDAPNRFGTVEQLAAQSTPGLFVQHLLSNGFVPVTQVSSGGFGPVFAPALLPQLKALLLSYLPLPSSFTAQGITEDQFLGQLDFYLGDFRAQNPGLFTGYEFSFNAQTLSAEVFDKIVKPAREAGALFKAFPTLTRLYTTLSPQDMSKDPVFSYNPALPGVSRDHTATLEVNCGLSGDSFTSPSVLVTEQGWSLPFPNGRGGAQGNTFTTSPGALRIETLAEEGSPVVTLDNAGSIRKFQSCGGCSAVDPLGLGVIALLAALRRRRAA